MTEKTMTTLAMSSSDFVQDLFTSFHRISPSPPLIITSTLTLLTLLCTLYLFRTWHRLSHIPGPLLNSLTPLVLTYHCLIKEDINTYVYNLSLKYGPLVRVAPNVVAHYDPETLRRVCSVKANYTKGLWFEFSRWDLERYSCIAMRDNESRKVRKGMLLPAWAGRYMVVMEGRVDSQVRSFLDLIKRKYTSTPAGVKAMDFGHRAQFYTLDVATSATFGKPWGFLEKDGDVEKYLETTEVITPMFGVLGTLPWLVYVMHAWPLNKLMPGEGDTVGFGRLMNLAGEAVRERVEMPGGKTEDSEYDLIRGYLRNGVEPEDAVQECITLVVAGTETTSIALRLALLALLTTPSTYRKAQDEVDAFYSGKPAPFNPDTDPIVSYADAKTLPYIQAVIREAFRIWPPSAGLFSKQVPDEGDTIHGYYLPKGTEVGQSMVGIGRQPRIWGDDAEIFRPERWLEADAEAFEEMQAAVDLVFSGGKYVCLGKHVGWMELLKWFVEVLRRYDVAVVNNAQPLKLKDPVTFMTTDFWVRFTKREGVEV
ncbi:cytochrome P450 [Immersiella caudata]|uniref:Cytochrome P450 n=1 Tax=Immersiella caudata TaxID=314043 RepID=A0AA39XCB2_9PEZI|nr:cytochrome P450 [Immersiella caudata]